VALLSAIWSWHRVICEELAPSCVEKPGGELEQIQFLLGHASIQTTERCLGNKQDLVQAVNDRVKIRLERD
jgi:hypothetical protein